MKILLLNGSPNKEGNTYYLLNEIKKEIEKENIETEIINVHDAVCDAKTPFCTVCSNPCVGACYKGTLLEEAYNKMEEADCIIVGSPVYFGTMSGQLKVFFDKTRRLRGINVFAGKPAGIVTVGDSPINQAYADTNHYVVNLADPFVVHGLVKVTDAIHRYGALASIELNLRADYLPADLTKEEVKQHKYDGKN